MMAGQPVIILKEGTERNTGRDAQKNNLMAGIAIAEAIKSTLGPKGMDKMLVDSLGDMVITNDGATILDELDVEHPAAKLLIQVSKSQDKVVGDGTTTAVVLAGELLKKGGELLDKKVHPTHIVSGYKKAAEEAQKILDEIALKTSDKEREVLTKIAMTALNSKSVSNAREIIANLAVDAALAVLEDRNGEVTVDIDNVKILQRQGKSLADSILIKGIALDKEVLHPDMPKRVENAKIALINRNIEVEKTEFDAEIRISDPLSIQAFLDQEEKMIKEMVEKIAATGANVLICQKGIDDLAQHFLAKKGIMAVRRVKKSDMEKLARATGARIISNLEDLTEKDLGEAGLVRAEKIGDDDYVFVEECKNPQAVTVMLRGASKYTTDEAERAFVDALSVVRDVLEDKAYLPGGGAPEAELSVKLEQFANKLSGKEGLAAKAFAEALRIIPMTLAENAGYDPIEKLTELISAHGKGENRVGLNVLTGEIADMVEMGVVEPLRVKKQAIKSASEAAEMIMRIDDVIAVKSSEDKGGAPGQGGAGGMPGMGGMGGMPGMM